MEFIHLWNPAQVHFLFCLSLSSEVTRSWAVHPMKSSCHYAWNYVTKKKHILEEFLFLAASLDVFSIEGLRVAGWGAVFVFEQELHVREGWGARGGSHLLAQFDSQPCYVGQERRNRQWQISDDVSESELGSLK